MINSCSLNNINCLVFSLKGFIREGVFLILSVWTSLSWAQSSPQTNYILQANESGTNKTYVARDYIIMKPGFQYTASEGNSLVAKIEPYLIDTNPFSSQIINGVSGAVVGEIDGSASVSSSGAASYDIPIKVVPGTGGMTPQLSITYSSQGSDGLLGVGFTISGLSSISRAPNNLKDGKISPVSLDAYDKFTLDGSRLVAVSGIYGENGTEYRTENNSFSKIISSTTTTTGPESFKVYTKSGLIYEYGSTDDSKFKAQNTEHIIIWLLNKVTDTKGNYYTITYIQDRANGEYKPSRIDYTGNTSSSPVLTPYSSVRFVYQNRSITNTTYINGNKSIVSGLLSKIEVRYQESVVKSYELNYNTPNYGKYLLAKVTESSATGEKVAPITFDWYTNDNYKPTGREYDQGYYATQYVNKADLTFGDFNGDGKTDFIATPKSGANFTGWKLFLADDTGSKCVYSASGDLLEGFKKIITGDFNGDGKTDIIQCRNVSGSNYTNYFVYYSTGQGFTYAGPAFFTETRNHQLIVGDFNGDGISDVFIYYPGSKDYRTFTSSYANGVITPLVEKSVRSISVSWNRVETGDFNGDGLTDFLNLDDNGYVRLYSDGYGTVSSSRTGNWPDKNHVINLGDFNGDGKTDMLVTGWKNTAWSEWAMNFSTGIDFERIYFPRKFVTYDKQIFVGDLNGDGKDDFYAVDKTGVEGQLLPVALYIADGNGSQFSYQEGERSYSTSMWNFYNGDFNGDGRTDYMCTSAKDTWAGYQICNGITDRDKLLKSATDSYGNITSFTYKPLTNKDVYTPYTNGSYPVSDFIGALQVVDKMTQPDGIGGIKSTSYKYAGAKLHKRGKGFLGFSKFTSTDDQTGISSISFYDYDPTNYVVGLKRTETRINKGSYSNQLLSETDYVNTYRQYQYDVYTYQPTSTTEKKYELGSTTPYSTTTASYTYDDYGNMLTSSQSFGTEATISSVNEYTNNTSNWFLGRLKKVTVTKNSAGQSSIRKSTFEYDPISGMVVKEIVEPDNSDIGFYKIYEHDAFGNILKSTTVANGLSRGQSSVYDDKGRFMIESYNSLNHKTKKVFDPIFGTETSLTDANSLTITTVYDSFGREKQSTGPDGSMSAMDYRWCNGEKNAPANALWFNYAQVSGKPGVKVYYDSFGRVIRNETVGFDGQSVFVDKEYDALGQVARQSDPYFKSQTPLWTSFTYDSLGRLKQKTLPSGAVIIITYNGLTTTTLNPLGQKDIRRTNQQGQLVESTNDEGKSITYVYNSAGNMTEMHDPKNSVIKMEYDLLGNRTKLIDPELGTTTSVYNAFGELISETDAKSNRLTLEYDFLGRMKKRTEAEGVTEWIYDIGTCGIGRLTSVTAPGGYKQETEYDKLGRTVKVKETIAGTTYTTSTAYDCYSRVLRTNYPSVSGNGPVIRNEYNSYGYLSKVMDDKINKVYWTAGIVNARGQLTQSIYGNGMQNSRIYNDVTGLLKHIDTSNSVNCVQNWSYEFDALGNLKTRVDDNRHLSESFTYDNLNRLINVSGPQSLSMTYDELGNILTKSDVGEYHYEDTQRPHSITSIIPYTASYPVNILKSISQNITYTSFDKVRTIAQGTDSLNINYGSAYQRVYADSYQNNMFKKRRVYVNSLYEQEKEMATGNIRETFYIFGGDGLVAIRINDASGDKVSYVHKDHLGSIQCLTDDTGALTQELSYDSWGNRRNPNGWAVYTTIQTGLITDRGFTGHEHLDLFDLVNMDGRVYDPVVGRFLSADPLIQDFENLQCLNRYSYCLNNPLSLTDPSGYSWLSSNWKLLATAAVTIAASVASAGLLAAPLTFWGAAASGAIGGFVGGVAGTLLNGGDLGQALKAGVIGGIIGGISGGLSYGVGSLKFDDLVGKMLAHGITKGAVEEASGGKFLHGFMAGAFTAGLAPSIDKTLGGSDLGKVVASMVIGGTAAELGGGKFANGAITGAYVMLFNDMAHHLRFKNKYAAYKYMIKQSILNKNEVAGVETKDGQIIVFREEGNTYDKAKNYTYKEGEKYYMNYYGEKIEVVNVVHTHPGDFRNDQWNPLGISSDDVSSAINGQVQVIMNNKLFSVSVNGNGYIPNKPIWKMK